MLASCILCWQWLVRRRHWHGLMDRLEHRATSPLAREAYRSKARPRQTLTGTHVEKREVMSPSSAPGLTEE